MGFDSLPRYMGKNNCRIVAVIPARNEQAMSDYCRTPKAPGPCLCAWPSITPDEYAQLLEVRRVHVVAQYREGARIAYDPASALRLAEYFESCGPHHFWVEGDPVFTPEREPSESKSERAARIKRSRERRLRAAVERIRAYEQDHPVNGHGIRTGPSVAANNYRHRAANVNRDLDAWKQYEQDQQTAANMRRLLKEG